MNRVIYNSLSFLVRSDIIHYFLFKLPRENTMWTLYRGLRNLIFICDSCCLLFFLNLSFLCVSKLTVLNFFFWHQQQQYNMASRSDILSNMNKASSRGLHIYANAYGGRGSTSSPSKQPIVTSVPNVSSSNNVNDVRWGQAQDWDFKLLQPKNIVTKQYVPGDFSKFAVAQQTKQNAIIQLINKVITQAIQSHLQALRSYLSAERLLQQRSKIIQNQFLNLFETKEALRQFIKNPIECVLHEIGIGGGSLNNGNASGIKQVLNMFAKRLIRLHNYALVENKLINLRQYNFNEYMQDQSRNMYVKSNENENVLIKIGRSKDISLVFFINNKIMNREDLMELNKSERLVIIDMVYRFLVDKKIAYRKQDLIGMINEKIADSMGQNLGRTRKSST